MFDLSVVVVDEKTDPKLAARLAELIRAIGLKRFVMASDWPSVLTPRKSQRIARITTATHDLPSGRSFSPIARRIYRIVVDALAALSGSALFAARRGVVAIARTHSHGRGATRRHRRAIPTRVRDPGRLHRHRDAGPPEPSSVATACVRWASPPASMQDTSFAIASNSKAYLAACLALLVDEGKLRWDDPSSNICPSSRCVTRPSRR